MEINYGASGFDMADQIFRKIKRVIPNLIQGVLGSLIMTHVKNTQFKTADPIGLIRSSKYQSNQNRI